MKAAVLTEKEQLEFADLPLPRLEPGDVLVEVKACGICRTDMKAYHLGQKDVHMPRILGHEISGIVAFTTGGSGEKLANKRVHVSPGISCGKCRFCLSGNEHLCNSIGVLGFHLDGGFAEYVRVPARAVELGVLTALPQQLDYTQATLSEPLACCINMQEKMKIKPGFTIFIAGAGTLGLLNARLAEMAGAQVIICDDNPKRLSHARQTDSWKVIDTSTDNLSDAIQNITRGEGVDAAIPCCPGTDAFNVSLTSLKKQGVFGYFSGIVFQNEQDFSAINHIHYRELSVHGAYGCAIRHNRKALRLINSGKINVNDLITSKIPLESLEEGINMVRILDGIKTVVEFN